VILPCSEFFFKYLGCIALGVYLIIKFRGPLICGVTVCAAVTASLVGIYREAIIVFDYKWMDYGLALLFLKGCTSSTMP
jgi:hypothetical protein